jgi:hypothetical protein
MFFIVLLIGMVAILPIIWLISEFQRRIWLRIFLGIFSLIASSGMFYIAAQFERFSYNTWYGMASQKLLTAEIAALEAGNGDVVKGELKRLQAQFQPSYENRANYDQLAEQAAARINDALVQKPASD